MFWIVIIVVFIVLLSCFNAKLKIKWSTLFKKGFRKENNKFGLYCFTGKQGTGKTYSAVELAISLKLKYNYKIITNVHSFNAFGDTVYFDSIFDIINYCERFRENDENVLIFFDEIFTVIEKNERMSKEILAFLSQMRKRRNYIYYNCSGMG